MSAMKIVFRVDASLQIGSGHIMRCLTLADALRERGAQCHFICRDHPGHLIELVRQKDYSVYVLPLGQTHSPQQAGAPHAAWLGATQIQDAEACKYFLYDLHPDWLIVDHYALDIQWEEILKPLCRHLMAIDDLADRRHACELLLDQNLGRLDYDYQGLVPAHCTVMAGPKYALLRPEFAAIRDYSLNRRTTPALHNILITMGGVDQFNVTSRVLQALKQSSLSADCGITVVMGAQSIWSEHVKLLATQMSQSVKVLVNVSNMHELMACADLAIGAAGSTSWERCCLGLPAILVELAINQREALLQLADSGAAFSVSLDDLESEINSIFSDPRLPGELIEMAANGSKITDGKGVARVGSMIMIED